MKINHIFVVGVMTVILMVSPVVVHAYTIEPIGDPVLGQSWMQNWAINANETGFAFVETFVFQVGGDPIGFKFPAGDNFIGEGWNANIVNAGYMVMHGDTPAYNLQYREHYIGNFVGQNFYRDCFLFDKDKNFIFGNRYHYDGGWFHIPDYYCNPWDDWYCKKRCKVPEPTTILLLGAGLIGLGILGRKRFRDLKS